MSKSYILAISSAILAAVCLFGATKLPLWRLRMEAPQYQDKEALKVQVFAGSMQGDLREITVLNQYVGVHIPQVLPQSKWLPQLLLGVAALGLFASVFPFSLRRAGLVLSSVVLAGAVAVSVVQARQQMYDIGHKRDAHTKLAGVHDFTPPFLGTAKIAQFKVSSWLGAGAYLIGAAFVLQLGAGFVSRPSSKQAPTPHNRQPFISVKTSEALA